jgi:1-acyl-sn-glycerol-3-phosphate acyltransferase
MQSSWGADPGVLPSCGLRQHLPAMQRPSPSLTIHEIGQFFLANFLLKYWSRFFYRLKIERDPTYEEGPAVIASNHRSFADPPVVSMAFRRPIGYFAKASLWKVPVIGQALRMFHGIPVDRNRPDAATMSAAVNLLKAGFRVLVFPEGTRTKTGTLGHLRQGPPLFARRAGVPIVPVYVMGSETAWQQGSPLPSLYGRLRIRVGKPVPIPAGLDGKRADRFATLYLERWMQKQERQLRSSAIRWRESSRK